jgi:putative peptide zinc metalloprotease protein
VQKQDDGIWTALAQHIDAGEYRPVRSSTVATVPLTTRHGDPYYMLANRDRGKYARLSPDEFHLWQLMDGTRTTRDLIYEYFLAFHSLAFDAVTQMVAQLRRQFMLADPPRDLFASLERTLTARRGLQIPRILWEAMTGQRALQVRHIDALFEKLHRRAAWTLYATPLQVLYVALAVIGGGLFLQHFASGRYDLFQAGGSYGEGFLLLIGLNFLCVVVHESCHALTCKHYGGQVHSAGLMLYFGLPAAFVDTTDVWTKPASARMATTWAGPYSGAILAGLGAVIVQAAPASWVAPILHRLSFLWLTTFAFNVIPFLELDGYYLAVDLLEMPLLRARALRFFRTELWDRLRHHRRLTAQERLLAWFGGLSVLFSGLVLFSAVWGWQYRFHALAATLWAGGVGSKSLLVLLFLTFAFPIAVQGIAEVGAVGRRLAAWTQRLRTPRGHALREREFLLRQVKCLSALSDEEAAGLAVRMPRHLFRPGHVIVHQGMEADRFYIVERGVAEVWVDDEPKPRRHLRRGDYFGESALLDREPHAATVCAGSWLSLFSVGRSDFDRGVRPHMCALIDERLYTGQAMRRFPAFAALPARQLDALASVVMRRRFDAGALVWPQGVQAGAIYFFEAGQAEAVIGGERRILGPGAYFGDVTVPGREPPPQTVRALTMLELLELPRADFDSAVAASLGRPAVVEPDSHQDGLRRVCCSSGARPSVA